jgi:hypothetical protein
MNDTYTIEANDDYAREVTTADDAVSAMVAMADMLAEGWRHVEIHDAAGDLFAAEGAH